MTIKERYKPFNYSETKCFVFGIEVTENATRKIEVKLPKQIKVIKGLYVTCSAVTEQRIIGMLAVFFNDGIFKNFSMPVLNTRQISHHSHPIPMNEEVKPNSTFTGVYYHRSIVNTYPFTISIYIHYTEQL